jgi:predicted ribosomally synthesized peptide with nif11-like leader
MKMNQNEMQKKIEELMANTEFTDKLSQCETCDEIAVLFGTEGIEVSGEELETAMERVAAQNENGELSEENLEQVAGGVLATALAIVQIGAPYAWETGQVLGKAIYNKYLKNKKKK